MRTDRPSEWDDLIAAEEAARGLGREELCDADCSPLVGRHSHACARRYVVLLEAERALE